MRDYVFGSGISVYSLKEIAYGENFGGELKTLRKISVEMLSFRLISHKSLSKYPRRLCASAVKLIFSVLPTLGQITDHIVPHHYVIHDSQKV